MRNALRLRVLAALTVIALPGVGLIAGAVAEAATLATAPTATTITATAAIASKKPAAVYYPEVRAQLTTTAGSLAVADRWITFFAGPERLCSAPTNNAGVATCAGAASPVSIITTAGYRAVFNGDAEYARAAAPAPLVGAAPAVYESAYGSVTGSVTSAAGGVRDVSVDLLNPAGELIAFGLTRADGTYVIDGVGFGRDYRVRFTHPDYVDQYYLLADTINGSRAVSVKAPKATKGVDAFLTKIDRVAPSIPTVLSVTHQNYEDIKVTWTPSPEPDLASYVLYSSKSAAGPFTRVTYSTLTATTLTFHPTRYWLWDFDYFAVSAVDATGNESAMSTPFVEPGFSAGRYEDGSRAVHIDAPARPYQLFSTEDSDGSSMQLAPGNQATLRFEGDRVMWLGRRGPDGGIAEVLFDGVVAATVDTYSPTSQYQSWLYFRDQITPGTHAVTVRPTGAKNSASSSANVSFDAFDVPDQQGPAAPSNLVATVVSNGIELRWTPPADADVMDYVVFRGTSDWYGVEIGYPTQTTLLDTGAAIGTTYYYSVAARDTGWNYSVNSNITSAGRLDPQAPPAPASVEAWNAGPWVQISWSGNATGSYEVFRGTHATGPFTKIAATRGTAYRDLNPPAGQQFYAVKAISSGHRSLYSGSSTVYRSEDWPAGTIEDDNPAVSFSGTWTAQSDPESSHGTFRTAQSGSASTSFLGSTIAWVTRAGPTGGSAEVSIDGVAVRTVDLYDDVDHPVVQWFSAPTGNGNHTISVSVQAPSDPASSRRDVAFDAFAVKDDVAPGAPTGVVAHGDADLAYLSWAPNPEQDLEGYVVMRGSVTTGFTNISGDHPMRGTFFSDNSPNGESYIVIAVDWANNHGESSEPVEAP